MRNHRRTNRSSTLVNASLRTRQWARRCRIEAARATHPATKAFLLELAAEYEAALGECVVIHPDDTDLQGAVADRLSTLAAKRKTWAGC